MSKKGSGEKSRKTRSTGKAAKTQDSTSKSGGSVAGHWLRDTVTSDRMPPRGDKHGHLPRKIGKASETREQNKKRKPSGYRPPKPWPKD